MQQRIPRHRDPAKRTLFSKAPYNFVPLPDEVYIQPKKDDDEKTFWGVIEYQLLAKTPLFVANKKGAKDFPVRDGKQYIPGTAIRGMLRSVLKAVTFGSFNDFADRYVLFRDLSDRFTPYTDLMKELEIRAGYLIKVGDEWFIRPIKSLNQKEFLLVDYSAVKSYFKPHDPYEEYSKSSLLPVCVRVKGNRGIIEKNTDCLPLKGKGKCKSGMIKALLVKSGAVSNKRYHYAFFAPDEKAELIKVDRLLIDSYAADRDILREKQTRDVLNGPEYAPWGRPVFYYMKEGELYFFGPTKFSRIRVPHKIGDFVPSDIKTEGVDLADSMLGTEKVKSRVFVTDAFISEGGGEEDFETVEVGPISTPKVQAYQHYMVQSAPEERIFTWLDEPENTTLRGRKFFWHGPNKLKAPSEKSKSAIYRKVKAARVGTMFDGKIFFEDLTEIELGALLTVLDLPPSKAHHLGMGKAHGLGSVRFDIKVRVFDTDKMFGDFADPLDQKILDDEQTQKLTKRVKERFRDEMVRFYNKGLEREARISGNSSVWEIPGIRALGLLLEWSDVPSIDKTSYLKFEGDDLAKWQKKVILPLPEGVAAKRVAAVLATDQVVAAAEEIEIWEKAVLTYEPGPRILRVMYGNKKTEVVLDRDMLILANLSDEARNRLIKKKKAIKAVARVAKEGNKYSVLEIWPIV